MRTIKKNKFYLTRNLRKKILQGDPWIYSDAINESVVETSLAKIHDQKKKFLAWGFSDPHSPLSLRVLSITEKPPTKIFFEDRFKIALNLRSHLQNDETNCFRLFNGEGDLLPGLICDIYDNVAVLQFDGQGSFDFWDPDWIAHWIISHCKVDTVYLKPRSDRSYDAITWGKDLTSKITVKENGCLFLVDVMRGQKTGFFLDQRNNRDYVRKISTNKTVLNLFSYSGGFSVYAGKGNARQVTSVDIAEGALNLAQENWKLNGLDKNMHQVLKADVFQFIHKIDQKYDVVICDPPSLTKSDKTKDSAVEKYVETFSQASKLVNENGNLVVSSCSSHINFNDFNEIVSQSLSQARKSGRVLRVSGQGEDHPFPQACPHLRYLKFALIALN